MGKRGNGEGNIRQRADGRWEARVSCVDENGKTGRKSYFGKTRKEVADKLNAALSDVKKGLPLPDEKLTVDAFLKQWLDDVAKPRVRQSTWENYECKTRLHILPYLGKRPIAKLTPRDLSGLYTKLLDKGLAAGTVVYCHNILHGALDQAMRWGLIARNPAELVDPPRPAKKEITTLSPEQCSILFKAAEGERLDALYVVAIAGGMRLGEILGLRWSDLDWDTQTVQVRRTLVRTKKNGLSYHEPKTAKGRRSVALPGFAITALRKHRAHQNEEKMRHRDVWDASEDLIFPNEIGKPIERQNLVRRSFKVLLTKAGLPEIRFHDLRHSAASLLLALGEHPKVVSERLGHSTIGITMDLYSHVTPTMQRDAAAKLERLFAFAQ